MPTLTNPERPKWFAPEHPSSTLHKIRYWTETQKLDISFKGNPTHFYRYEAVPANVHEALSKAPSPGIYYGKGIRDAFKCTKMEFAKEPA